MIRKVPGERGEPADLVCCSAFPACNFVRYEVVGDCPIADCDGHLVRAYGKYGMYYRCDLGCGYVTQEVIPTNKRCPDCQSALVMKKAKTGQTFITCSKDSCTYVEREYKGRCPKCGKDMFLFFTRQGSEFIACSDRECGYVDHEKTGDDCPKCGGDLVFREGKKGKFISCSNYPDCEFKHSFKLKMVFASYRCPKCGDLLFRFRSPGTQVEMIFCGNRDRCDYKHHSIPLDQVLGICPDCGGQLYKKKGKTGNFIGCENYPSCTHISPYIPDKAPACPKCGLGMTKRRSKKGVSFWSCSNFPKCDGVEFENEPQGECPKCDGVLLKRKGPNGQFLGCSNYPACDYVRDMKMLDEMCPDCGKPLMKRKGSNGTFTACSGYPDCKYVLQKTEGSDLLDRSCPQCNSPLVLKERQSTGEKFVSCSGYPHCKHAEPADPLEIYPKGSVKKELFLICKDDSTIRLVVFVALSGILRVLVEADGFKYDIVNVNGISKGNVSRVEGRTFSLKLILHGVLLSKNLKKNNKMFAGWVVGFVGTQVETGVGGYIEMNIEISNRLNKRFSADVSDFKGNGEYEPGVVIGGKFIG
jgi:ssDNA-binding Zn-finger/Zn-ribbon topoisomerase 1